jgi:N-acyl-D-aspartate/D-glutamate deacylase
VCGPVGEYGGTYISHLRSEGDQFLECLEELLEIGRRAGCRTEVYHLKAAGRHNWPKMQHAIDRIQRARDAGQDVGANMYPYRAGGTSLSASIPTGLPRRRSVGLAGAVGRPDCPRPDGGGDAGAVG